MSRKLIIVVCGASRPALRTATPFLQAAAAASMGHPVDVICTGPAADLMVDGLAQQLGSGEGDPSTVYDAIQAAHAAGARFWICTADQTRLELSVPGMISECSGVIGTGGFISQVMDADVRLLTY
jgi:uncharacterized protein